MNLRSSNHKYGVDAGNIGVMDYAATNRWPLSFCQEFDLKQPGLYKITIKVANTWLGNKQRTHVIETTSGKFVVGDIGYMVKGEHPFFDMANEGKDWFCVDTGGDGHFMARVTFKYIAPSGG